MKRTFVALSALAVLAAVGAGAWWYAADAGMIPGRPNSPRPENFKAALDQHFSQPASFGQRPCAHAGYSPALGRAFPDVRFDWTPVGFRALPDARTDAGGQLAARLELLAKYGLLQAGKTPEGATQYTMDWKGYAATNGAGCFFIASAEREAKIIGFEKKRVENGVEIYEVTARAQPVVVEPWAQSAEFKARFGSNAPYARLLDPDPVSYELARGERGFSVIAERGQQPQARTPSGEDAALTAKLAGTLTAERVLSAVETWLARTGAARTSMCLRLPTVPGEADEVQPPLQQRTGLPVQAQIGYIFYNLVGRERHSMDNILRGYEIMKRLETLGFVRSELLSVPEVRGTPALGGVRFDIEQTFAAKLVQDYQPCYPVGTLHPDEVVSFVPFSATNLRPRFIVRLTLKEADVDAKRLIDRFGHLARVAAVGTLVTGTLRYAAAELQVESAQVHMPQFFPDTRELALPAIQVAAPRAAVSPPGTAVGVPGAVGTSGVASAADVYAIGVYEGTLPGGAQRGFQQHPEGTVNVTVRRSGQPVALYLSAYEPVHWVVTVAPGAKLARIVTSGYHPQRVTATGASGFDVLRVPYASINGESAQHQLARAALQQLGRAPLSAQYSYKGGAFEVGRH